MLLMQELRHTKNHRGKWTREHIYPKLAIDVQRPCCTSAQKAPDCTTRRLNCITRGVLYIDKKPRHYVLNAIANKLLRIIFTLVEKGEYYDANFIRQDPRVVKYN